MESLVCITEEEVIRATKEAGRNRAPGPDGIRNEHIKETMTLLLPTWTALLNKMSGAGTNTVRMEEIHIKVHIQGKRGHMQPQCL
jgi:hypothetical protein